MQIRTAKKVRQLNTKQKALSTTQQEQINEFDKQNSLLNQRNEILEEQKLTLHQQVNHEKERFVELSTNLTRQEVENNNLREKLNTQKEELEQLQQKFTTEFENIAHKILRKNTEDFSQSNQKNINEILSPLKEKIQLFEKKVEDTYEKGLKDQTDLKAELKKLHDLNTRISDEANNLTKALKGDVKKQGNWGEVILERILERSGLRKGSEYMREEVVYNQEGKLIRPDVIIHLPDKKHIIVDSKVSLVAYDRWVNTEDNTEKEQFVKEHLTSLKAHIKGLNQKHYQTAEALNTPDFVLLFIPIESSFSLAINQDQELFNYAWDNQIVIVSPSTLLATLRTIASIWKQENQTSNALEIARQGGALYDKFVNFLKDLEGIGRNLDVLRKNYDGAINKLSSGRGNLMRSAEKLKTLGAKTSKEIPAKFMDALDE
ncbi:DNA recombination protein RmuC [Puteibacter caeruleilacunae]|nr:DNA recombination protein RmuC [Puteibacter caeruleilacunae]